MAPPLFLHFKQIKTSAAPYFPFLNNIRPQPYFSRTLFQHFLHCKNPAVPYFSILKTLKSQSYLFLVFEQYETPAVLQPYLIYAFSTITFFFVNNLVLGRIILLITLLLKLLIAYMILLIKINIHQEFLQIYQKLLMLLFIIFSLIN